MMRASERGGKEREARNLLCCIISWSLNRFVCVNLCVRGVCAQNCTRTAICEVVKICLWSAEQFILGEALQYTKVLPLIRHLDEIHEALIYCIDLHSAKVHSKCWNIG
ncbi:hypothetical protein XENORESO_020631 [Xenotaenia resolanae]|uniref:Uncharacterized protein n=1 Tax=Xenotaenia resolanae TaxID=208358 RepID=A0ABV0WFU2_9TELE